MSGGGIRLHSLRSFHTVEHALKLRRNLFSLALASQSSFEARASYVYRVRTLLVHIGGGNSQSEILSYFLLH
jgi:hypothetical protein